MPWYLLSGVYLISWSALLVHCLLQRQFYPVLGTRWGTKAFWILTFIFLNPFLTFLYFVFGFLLQPARGTHPGRPIRLGSVPAIASVAFVLVFFEWPLLDFGPKPVILKKDGTGQAENKRLVSRSSLLISDSTGGAIPWGQAHIAWVKTRNGVQTFASTSAESDDKASLRNIVLICQRPDLLLDRVARQFQKALLELADVEKVEYYPCGTWPTPGGTLPDIFITMDMLELREKAFLCNRQLGVVIQWQVSDTLLPGPARTNHANSPPSVGFYTESRLDHDSTMMGIESPRSTYKVEADSIAAEMVKSVSKQFATMLDKYGQMPQVPAVLYGTYREPPDFSFLKDNQAERLISANGLFKDNLSVWRFAEPRGTEEALTSYRDQLQAAGWKSETLGKDYLQMQKQDEYIYIFRDRRRDPSAAEVGPSESGSPADEAASRPAPNAMVARYESCFSSERIREAMDALLAGQVQTGTLITFEQCLRTPEQAEHLRAAIEASPNGTLDGFLALGRYWADRGQMEKGREALMRALAMQRADKLRNAKSAAIKSLAKKLGDENLAEAPVSEQVLRGAGFANVGELSGPLEIERALDEPVLLYRRLDDGTLRTVALRVVRSWETGSAWPYGLLAVDGRRERSNASVVPGAAGPDGSWAADFLLHGAAGESEFVQAQVRAVGKEQPGRERFLFIIRP